MRRSLPIARSTTCARVQADPDLHLEPLGAPGSSSV